jgi:hypothetical protein
MKNLLAFASLVWLSQCTFKKVDSPPMLEFPDSPAASGSSLPYLFTGADGILYLTWIMQLSKEDTAKLFYSYLKDKEWQQPIQIASGIDWFINWADYPQMAANKNGDLIAHVLKKSGEGTYAYDVALYLKKSQENNWIGPIIPHQDKTETEHGFVSMIPLPDNQFQVAWLDGRNTANSNHDNDHGHGGAMTLRTAVISTDGQISQEYELDNRVCDCCQTGGALTTSGPVFVFRDRSDTEIRDISIVRFIDGSWTSSINLSNDQWEIMGCPVNGPRVDALNDEVAVVWFTAVNEQAKVKIAFSSDQGLSFGDPIVVAAGETLGRVDVAFGKSGEAIVCYVSNQGSKTSIWAERIDKSGKRTTKFQVAETDQKRSSGFPQLTVHDGKVWFAWTDSSGETPTIRMAHIEL